jgi:cyanate lyase
VIEIPSEKLVEQYKKLGRSWSEIAHNIGLEPKAAGRLILEYPATNIFQ